ncbi:MAG: hypothetical protein ACE5DY_08635 [Mariprofundaceae bacterium]
MDETEIRTLEDVEQFLTGTTDTSLKLQGSKDDVYAWIQHTLVRFRYMGLRKKPKGLVRGYIKRLTGYSRPQMSRLIRQYRKTGHIRRRQRTVKGFETKYTKVDIRLLADVDRLVDGCLRYSHQSLFPTSI